MGWRRQWVARVAVVLSMASVAVSFAGEEVRDRSPFMAALDEKAREQRAFMQQPNGYFEERLSAASVVIQGQRLHPKLQYEFEERQRSREARGITDYNAWMMDLWADPEGRQWLRDAAEKNWVKLAYDAGPAARSKDYHIPGPNGPVRARVYWPAMAEGEKRPILLYFHGGAFLIASIEAVEPQMQILVNEGGLIVVSVDYALAPEQVFPAAHQDALAVWDWLQQHAGSLGGDPRHIAVGGDSAGANLAIVVADEQLKRDAPAPVAQLLYYPFTDSRSEAFESFEAFGNGYGLDKDFIRIATDAVVGDPADLEHPWLRVLQSVNHAKQPPALIATAGFDPIRDQGLAYVRRLQEAGVAVEHHHYPSLNHGFLDASGVIDDAQRACLETARAFARMLGR